MNPYSRDYLRRLARVQEMRRKNEEKMKNDIFEQRSSGRSVQVPSVNEAQIHPSHRTFGLDLLRPLSAGRGSRRKEDTDDSLSVQSSRSGSRSRSNSRCSEGPAPQPRLTVSQLSHCRSVWTPSDSAQDEEEDSKSLHSYSSFNSASSRRSGSTARSQPLPRKFLIAATLSDLASGAGPTKRILTLQETVSSFLEVAQEVERQWRVPRDAVSDIRVITAARYGGGGARCVHCMAFRSDFPSIGDCTAQIDVFVGGLAEHSSPSRQPQLAQYRAGGHIDLNAIDAELRGYFDVYATTQLQALSKATARGLPQPQLFSQRKDEILTQLASQEGRQDLHRSSSPLLHSLARSRRSQQATEFSEPVGLSQPPSQPSPPQLRIAKQLEAERLSAQDHGPPSSKAPPPRPTVAPSQAQYVFNTFLDRELFPSGGGSGPQTQSKPPELSKSSATAPPQLPRSSSASRASQSQTVVSKASEQLSSSPLIPVKIPSSSGGGSQPASKTAEQPRSSSSGRSRTQQEVRKKSSSRFPVATEFIPVSSVRSSSLSAMLWAEPSLAAELQLQSHRSEPPPSVDGSVLLQGHSLALARPGSASMEPLLSPMTDMSVMSEEPSAGTGRASWQRRVQLDLGDLLEDQ